MEIGLFDLKMLAKSTSRVILEIFVPLSFESQNAGAYLTESLPCILLASFDEAWNLITSTK